MRRCRRAFLLLGLFAAIGWPSAALAKDYGPAEAVATVGHDLPILLAAGLEYYNLAPTTDWVVTDGTDAVALWHAGNNHGIVALQRRSGR
jgi:hypothetical protein